MCHRTGRGFRRGSAKRAPLLNPCLPARAGGEPPQWEIQTDKGVVRPAAEGEDTAPQDVQHFHVAVGDQWSPNGQARSAWPNKGRGRLACPNPPCVSIPAQARRSRYFERGRGGSVPQLPQAAPGCPQALARSLTSRAGLRGPAPSLPRSFPARDWTTAVGDNRRSATAGRPHRFAAQAVNCDCSWPQGCANGRLPLEKHGLAFYASVHPSPINHAARREVWDAIPETWAEAASS